MHTNIVRRSRSWRNTRFLFGLSFSLWVLRRRGCKASIRWVRGQTSRELVSWGSVIHPVWLSIEKRYLRLSMDPAFLVIEEISRHLQQDWEFSQVSGESFDFGTQMVPWATGFTVVKSRWTWWAKSQSRPIYCDATYQRDIARLTLRSCWILHSSPLFLTCRAVHPF